MGEIAGEAVRALIVSIPLSNVDTSLGGKDLGNAQLLGALVGRDKLVLCPTGGIIIRSLEDMKRDPRFRHAFLDLPAQVLPPNMVENIEAKIERLMSLLPLLLTVREKPKDYGEDLVAQIAEGPSGLGLFSSGQETLSPEESVALVSPVFVDVGRALFSGQEAKAKSNR